MNEVCYKTHHYYHLTLGMLLHYLGKLNMQIFYRYAAHIEKMQTNCIFTASTFVIHPEISIFSVFKIASFSPYRLQIKFFMSLFSYLFPFVINLWHRKFITADVTAVFVNNKHGIQ